MAEAAVGPGLMTWQDELANLMGDTEIQYSADDGSAASTAEEGSRAAELMGRVVGEGYHGFEEEGLKDQVKGFVAATGELVKDLGKGMWEIAQQSLIGVEDSYVAKKLRKPAAAAAERLGFLNEYLPEDKDPLQAWPVVIAVFLVALVALNVNCSSEASDHLPKKLYISPPSATRILLPDGRYLAYQEQGVPPVRARFSLIASHSFLSSRIAGIPGIRASLLEEFGVRLVTYDLPGFGESDPHPGRNLNSSASDVLHLVNALGIMDKFWVVGYSGGSMHAWAAVRYIPDKLAGVAMLAPLVNPYDSSMTKEERRKIWEKWTTKRKFMYVLARRFPSLLSNFYHRSFLSGRPGWPEKWLSLSLGKKDKSLLDEQIFKEFWEKDVGESVRQGDAKPFVEEAVLQVSDWGFSLSDIQVQKQRENTGLLRWLKSIYSQAERERAGFLGPIHIWQGMDDRVVPPSMTEFVRRVVPGATVHRLLGEGHFSYFCFCDECHRQIFSTLFGIPQGPVSIVSEVDELLPEGFPAEIVPDNSTDQE